MHNPSSIASVRAAVFAPGPYAVGAEITLDESEAHHLRVVRLAESDRLALRDGAGAIAEGVITRLAKNRVVVTVDVVTHAPPPYPVHLLVPIADRDRMLWLAEKVAELNIASWRSVLWHRSRSVSPRGEGEAFQAKLRARMQSALLQSRSAWLPELHPDATPVRAVAVVPPGVRIVLDVAGRPITTDVLAGSSPVAGAMSLVTPPPVTIAVGPEGGFEESELAQLQDAEFIPCTLGASILRFETAAVAAVAVVRSLLLTVSSS